MMQALEKAGGKRELPIRLIRSGTGIAANLSEAVYGSSRRDFFPKTRISWRNVPRRIHGLNCRMPPEAWRKRKYSFIDQDCTEILNMLISINKTAQPDSY